MFERAMVEVPPFPGLNLALLNRGTQTHWQECWKCTGKPGEELEQPRGMKGGNGNLRK